jgi:ribonuclease-3
VKIDFSRLCRKLNYEINNKALNKRALKHRSAGAENYERFEFVGDSILNFVIANALFSKFSEQHEGELSRLRAHLVKGETLAEVGVEMGLGDYLILGPGELKSGGFKRASILADSLEAIFAAVYFDSGMDAAQQVILKLYQSRLDNPNLADCLKDAKTQLQELLQSQKKALPKYVLTKIEGDEHDQVFFIECTVAGLDVVTKGHAHTRRKAEQIAAEDFLVFLRK